VSSFGHNFGIGSSLLANTGVARLDLSGALMKEVSSRADGAFQFLITRWMVSGSVWSRTLSTTNLDASSRPVLRVHSLADSTDMRTFDKLGSTSKATVPAVNVTSIVVATGCVDRVEDQFHSLCRFCGSSFVVSTNSEEVITEVIMKVG
jgi:hypothetical protein